LRVNLKLSNQRHKYSIYIDVTTKNYIHFKINFSNGIVCCSKGNIEREAESIDHTVVAGPYTSCYDTLLEEKLVMAEAKDLRDTARCIREKFADIINEGFVIPTGSLLRKATIVIRKRKLSFSVINLFELAIYYSVKRRI